MDEEFGDAIVIRAFDPSRDDPAERIESHKDARVSAAVLGGEWVLPWVDRTFPKRDDEKVLRVDLLVMGLPAIQDAGNPGPPPGGWPNVRYYPG